MNIERLSTMAEDELRTRANAHLEHLDIETESHQDKQHHVAQAQLYLVELDRRRQTRERIENDRIADRDYKLELWVIWLIGAELVLAFAGIVLGWVEGNKQMDVLDNLNKSGAETAAALAVVRQAQEASLDTQKHTLDNIVTMNNSLRDELDLNFTEALQYSGGMSGAGYERVNFTNNGRSVLSLWGSKFGSDTPKMQERPTVLSPGSSVPFDISHLVAKTRKTMGSSTDASIPFELYLKREDGTKYVSRGSVQVNRDSNMTNISQITTTRKQW